mmetsp:Transcript_104014/g.155769  ORF Transcript_104014/g.155769 Transcript_104014/m.155769 type:complete len:373 (-) Transcript_104014:24-1142(-)
MTVTFGSLVPLAGLLLFAGVASSFVSFSHPIVVGSRFQNVQSFADLHRGARSQISECRGSVRREGPGLPLRMSTTEGQKKKVVSTDEKKLALGRYELFPKRNMSEEVDFSQVMHHGGQDLRRLYHDSDRVLIVEYYKERCSMCRVLRPLMQQVFKEFGDRLHVVEVEVLENKDVIMQAGLRAVPTVHVFKSGMLVDHFNGLHAKSKLRKRFQETLDQFEHASDEEVQEAFDKLHPKLAVPDAHITYPIKHIHATGRVLYPAHWNSLFHTNKTIENDDGEKQSTLDIFLDNGNCLGDDGHEFLYVEALRKGKMPGSGVLGRISDGETNIQYGEDDESRPVLVHDEPIFDKAGRVVHQICDSTGCTLIVKHSEE